MSDWIHCNSCYRQPGNGLSMSLTNCGHIYCDSCLAAMNDRKCKMCGGSFMAIPVMSQMKPDIQAFFTDPGDLEKQHNKTLLQVIDFQRNHRQRYIAYLQKKIKNGSASGSGSKTVTEQQFFKLKEEAEKKIQSLMQENAQLRQLVDGGRRSLSQLTGTPSPHHARNTPSPRNQSTPYASQSTPINTPGLLPNSSLHSVRSKVTPVTGTAPTSATASKTPTQLTPTGPSRISVRTPPVNGRIGPVAGSSTDGRYATARKTPEAHSPMDTSPLARAKGRTTPGLTAHGVPALLTPQAPAIPSSRQDVGQSRTISPVQLDLNKRQIHLRYQPRSTMWQKNLATLSTPPG